MKGNEVGEEEVTKVEDLLSELSFTIVSSSGRKAVVVHDNDSSQLALAQNDVTMSVEKEEEDDDGSNGESTSTRSRNPLFSIVQKLNNFDPNTIFTIITPSLFLITTNNDVALQSLITIVSTNPNRYTLPALNAILTYIQQHLPIDNDNQNINVDFQITHELLHTIFQQVQHSSLSISNVATKVLVLLGTKLPPSLQQRQITSNILLLLHTHFQQLVRSIRSSGSSSSNGGSNNDKENSILLIRYLSLMMEIFINVPNNNNMNIVQSYLHVHTLSEMSTISIMLLDNDTNTTTMMMTTTDATTIKTSTATSTIMSTSQPTILDPMLDLLQDIHLKDPLLIINIFDILENITNHTSSSSSSSLSVILLLSWIEQYMIDYLLAKVGFYVSRSSDGSTNVLCCNNDIDTFCYASALTILSKCCNNSTCTNDTTYTTTTINNKHKLTTSMMITIFKYILHSIISESYDDIEKIHYIHSLVTFIRSNDHDNNNHASHRLKLILDENDMIEFWFNLKQGNVKYKAAVLNSIAQVLQYTTATTKNVSQDDDGTTTTTACNVSDEMCMTMYVAIGNINNNIQTTDMLMELVKSSIIEIRLATYQIFQSIIKNRSKNSGQYLLLSHVGFLEMLLNRNLELVKEGKEMKYDIVCSILKSEVKGYLNEDVVNVLEQFVNQGPYYYQGMSGDILLE